MRRYIVTATREGRFQAWGYDDLLGALLEANYQSENGYRATLTSMWVA